MGDMGLYLLVQALSFFFNIGTTIVSLNAKSQYSSVNLLFTKGSTLVFYYFYSFHIHSKYVLLKINGVGTKQMKSRHSLRALSQKAMSALKRHW